jgi:hypothetical protein
MRSLEVSGTHKRNGLSLDLRADRESKESRLKTIRQHIGATKQLVDTLEASSKINSLELSYLKNQMEHDTV